MLSQRQMQTILNKVLQGTYSFKRIISFPEIDFEGMANFIITSYNKRIYNEKGYYNKNVICYQKQFFNFDLSDLYIYKSDNSLLHYFSIDRDIEFPIMLSHIHQCEDDQYSLEITINSEDSFLTFYRINGPAKNYTIHTNFNRVVKV